MSDKKLNVMNLQVTISKSMAEWNEIVQSIQDDDIAISLVNEFHPKLRCLIIEKLSEGKSL